jgi:hypothetical protein
MPKRLVMKGGGKISKREIARLKVKEGERRFAEQKAKEEKELKKKAKKTYKKKTK